MMVACDTAHTAVSLSWTLFLVTMDGSVLELEQGAYLEHTSKMIRPREKGKGILSVE